MSLQQQQWHITFCATKWQRLWWTSSIGCFCAGAWRISSFVPGIIALWPCLRPTTQHHVSHTSKLLPSYSWCQQQWICKCATHSMMWLVELQAWLTCWCTVKEDCRPNQLSLESTGVWETADIIFVLINISAAGQTSCWAACRRPYIDLTAYPVAGEQTVCSPAQARALMNILIPQVYWPTAATHFYMVLWCNSLRFALRCMMLAHQKLYACRWLTGKPAARTDFT